MKDQTKKVQELQKLIKSGQGKATTPALMVAIPKSKAADTPDEPAKEKPCLEVIHEQKLLFKAPICNYTVLGSLPQDFSMLPITLHVSEDGSNKKGRYKLDLYEREQCRTVAGEQSEIITNKTK